MGKIETSRLLDTRFLDLDTDAEESGVFLDAEVLVALTPV